MRGQHARWAWALMAVGLLGLIGVVPFAVWTHLGQRADERSRWSAVLGDEFGDALLQVLNQVSVPLVAAGALAAVIIAVLRRRLDLALGVVLLVGAANVATQLGKALLPRRDFGIGGENTLPSGHMTVITGLLVAFVIVAPRLLRLPAVVVASFLATLAGAAIIIHRWHRPSDVIAAVGVLAIATGLSLLLAGWWRGRGRDSEAPTTAASDSAPSDPADMPGAPGTAHGASLARPRGAARPFVAYLLAALASAAMSGVALYLGGLAAQAEPSNAIVAAVAFTIVGIAASVLIAMAATGSDAVDDQARAQR